MWYTRKMKNALMIVLLTIMTISCTQNDSNTHWFYGEWKVRDATWTLVNGKPGPTYVQEYYLELNENNCGTKYNINKEVINEVKWIFEWVEEHNYHFLLYNTLSESSGSNDLARGNLYSVTQFTEEKMTLTRRSIGMSNDTTFHTIWNLKLTKE